MNFQDKQIINFKNGSINFSEFAYGELDDDYDDFMHFCISQYVKTCLKVKGYTWRNGNHSLSIENYGMWKLLNLSTTKTCSTPFVL